MGKRRRRKRVIVRPSSTIHGKVPAKGWRPKTRADCVDGPRPCPFYGCRYHLALDAQPSGLLVLPFGDKPGALERMRHTCALDVADAGPHRNLDLSGLLGISRQRVNQVEQSANAKMREVMKGVREDVSDTLEDFMGR